MILAAVFFPARLHRLIPLVAALGLVVFLASVSGLVGDSVAGLRVDLVVFVSVALATTAILVFNRRSPAVD